VKATIQDSRFKIQDSRFKIRDDDDLGLASVKAIQSGRSFQLRIKY